MPGAAGDGERGGEEEREGRAFWRDSEWIAITSSGKRPLSTQLTCQPALLPRPPAHPPMPHPPRHPGPLLQHVRRAPPPPPSPPLSPAAPPYGAPRRARWARPPRRARPCLPLSSTRQNKRSRHVPVSAPFFPLLTSRPSSWSKCKIRTRQSPPSPAKMTT